MTSRDVVTIKHGVLQCKRNNGKVGGPSIKTRRAGGRTDTEHAKALQVGLWEGEHAESTDGDIQVVQKEEKLTVCMRKGITSSNAERQRMRAPAITTPDSWLKHWHGSGQDRRTAAT